MRASQQRFDLGQRDVARQLHRQRLAVAAHGADADAQAVDRNRILVAPEDLVAFGACPSILPSSARCRGPCRSTAAGFRPADGRTARPGTRSRASWRSPSGRCRGWPIADRQGVPRRSRARPPSATRARACSARRLPRRPGRSWRVTHSTRPARNRPLIAISIRLTVQLPPMKFLTPRSRAWSMTWRLTGSSTITASSFMRSVDAASIQ